jgi:alkyldihydroxyacetonephosphate synthase
MQARLKHFGWGREGEGLTPPEEAFVVGRIERLFGTPADREVKPPRLGPNPYHPFVKRARSRRYATRPRVK